MKLAEKELKALITIFLSLSWGIGKVESCFEGLGVSVTVGQTSPFDLGKLGDFILDMFEVPKDCDNAQKCPYCKFHRDWFYMTIHEKNDVEITDRNLEERTNEIYNFLANWREHVDKDNV